MRLIPSNVRSTQPHKRRSKKHDVGVFVTDADEMKNLIAMDFAGRYPVTSRRGHKYIFIMYDYDSNYTFAIPVKSRKTSEYLRAFQECYDELKNRGFTAQLLRLDNEISKDLIACIRDNELDFQIVSPGNHRNNSAERAIQTFKSYFKSARAGTHPSFPANGWDLLIPQTILILNLIQPSCINPAISAYNQIHGIFDFNATPLSIPGIKVCVHDRPAINGSWADKGTKAFYINRAPNHYRKIVCWVPSTNAFCTSDTVEYFPHECDMPTPTNTEKLTMILGDLLERF